MTTVDIEAYRGIDADAPAERLRECLASHGYVAIRGLLDPEPVRAAAERAGELLRRAGLAQPRPGPRQPRFEVGQALDEEIDLELALMSDEALEAVFHAPTVLAAVRAAWGGTEAAFVHPTKVVRAVAPEGTDYHSRAGVHQDLPELQCGPRQLTMWCPLVAVGAESGALPVYPGSHRHGVLPLELADNPSGWAVRPDALRAVAPVAHCGDLVPGDVLLMTALTAHGDARNLGDGWRLSVEARFQPMGDPVSAPVLDLPGREFGWDEVYAGWHDLVYYWRGEHPDVVAFDDCWERWRDVEALAVPAAGGRALAIASQAAPNPWIRLTARRLLEGEPDAGGWTSIADGGEGGPRARVPTA